MQNSLLEQIRSCYPDPLTLPYYNKLFAGGWDHPATVRAHLQDLARSIGCRGLREIQLAKLTEMVVSGAVKYNDAKELRAIIEDELDAPGRRSHLDIRLMLFDNCGFTRNQLESVIPLHSSKVGTTIFRRIFEERSLLQITAAVGAIEEWYVPLATQLEICYLSLGYSRKQVSTYTLHKIADIRHSQCALEFVVKYAQPDEFYSIIEAVNEGFLSVKQYDEARFSAAMEIGKKLGSYLKND